MRIMFNKLESTPIKGYSKILWIVLTAALVMACNDSDSSSVAKSERPAGSPLFTKIDAASSQLHFRNDNIQKDLQFNFLTYPNSMSGSGVAVGDVDNDGLPDLFFGSNFGQDMLYRNKGNMQFEDITQAAGINAANGFTTGVTMLDVNNDGWVISSNCILPLFR